MPDNRFVKLAKKRQTYYPERLHNPWRFLGESYSIASACNGDANPNNRRTRRQYARQCARKSSFLNQKSVSEESRDAKTAKT